MTNLLVRLFIGSGGDTEDPEIRGKYGTLAGIVGSSAMCCCLPESW